MSETPTQTLRRAARELNADADNIAAIGPKQARAFAALLEAVANDDPEDPLHDPDCRTCNAALNAARAYLGEEAHR